MKKELLVGALVTVMVLSAGTTIAFAAGAGTGLGRNFVDEDGNGICDHAVGFCRFIDENNDGVCDYYDGCDYGHHFVDDDNDGVCDNHCGYGLGKGRGFRGGRCR